MESDNAFSPKPRRFGGCLPGVAVGCLSSVLLLVGTFVALAAGFGFAGKHFSQQLATVMSKESLDYESLRGNGTRQVLRLELSGIITGTASNRWYVPRDCDTAVRAEIEDAIDDSDLEAILLVVNSPGGGVTASDALYHALERFKAAKNTRKVIVLGEDLIASGAYYAAMQADWIRLRPTTVIGSIGVIVPGINAYGLALKLGIADNSVTSGASKDLGNPLKPVNPEHTAILKTVTDNLYKRFVTLVAKGRHMTETDVRAIADGRIFTAEDAVNLRLADDIGYEDTIDSKIAELLDCKTEELIIYEPGRKENAFRAFLSEFPSAMGRGFAAPLMDAPSQTPEYRW